MSMKQEEALADLECTACEAPIVVAIFKGTDILIDPQPAYDGTVALLGCSVLPKPIATEPCNAPNEPRYRPHRLSCTRATP